MFRTIIITEGMSCEFTLIRTDATDGAIKKHLKAMAQSEAANIDDFYRALENDGYTVSEIGSNETMDWEELSNIEYTEYDLNAFC